MLPCVYVVETPTGRQGYPPGCRETRWTAVLKREPGARWRNMDGFCVAEVHGRKLVLPERVCTLLDKASRGERVAAVFLGPPGTGKSEAMRLVAEVWPGPVEEVEAEALLGSLVGQTEQRLREILDRCEARRSCLLAVDEADIFLGERGQGGQGDGYSRISENLVRMFLRRLQKWSEARRAPSVVMTTNKPISKLDSAMIRGFRLEPVVFPPPSPEAIVLLGRLMGREVSREEAARAAALAPTFANIAEWLRGGELKRFRVSSGIAIIGVDKEVPKAKGVPRDVVAAAGYPVSVALAAVLAQSFTDKPLVIALDLDRLEEAAWLAESMDAYLGVMETPLQQVAESRLLQYRVRKIFIGSSWRVAAERVTLDTVERIVPRLRRELGCRFLDAGCLLRAAGLA